LRKTTEKRGSVGATSVGDEPPGRQEVGRKEKAGTRLGLFASFSLFLNLLLLFLQHFLLGQTREGFRIFVRQGLKFKFPKLYT
jgi:hypothetical protein